MSLGELVKRPGTVLGILVLEPVRHVWGVLNETDRWVVAGAIGMAAVVAFLLGRRRPGRPAGYISPGAWRFPRFQMEGFSAEGVRRRKRAYPCGGAIGVIP
jgi:hypothetical protein